MFDLRVAEPRMTAQWTLDSGDVLEPAILDGMRRGPSLRYGVVFDSIGFNLYRDGHDSVAWHRDRIVQEIVDPVVALVSLGEPRSSYFDRAAAGGPGRSQLVGAIFW